MRKKTAFILLIAMFFPILSVSATTKVSCGNITDIPAKIPELTSFAMTLIQIVVPVILVVMGSIDLFKGMTAQKEDEIKKGQQIFVKRLITGAIIFFVVVIAKLFISIVADSSSANIIECMDCFLSDKCNSNPSTHDGMDSSSTNNSSTNNSSTNNSSTNSSSTNSSSTNSSSTNSSSTNNSSTNNSSTNNSSTNSSSTNNSSTNSSSTNNTTSPANKYYNLFVGDSRTVGMCGTHKLCGSSEYIAEIGKGYSWFEKTAIPKINNKIKSNNYNIIILMGVNDVGKNGSNIANKYYNKIAELAKTTWKNQNIIYISVNPVKDGKSNAYMSGVNSFNSQMKSKINSSKLSNLKYCDTVSKLSITSIDSGDGLHYNKKGYTEIYNIIKNNCLK